MSRGVKMHFQSVSVYVNLSKNSLSPKYGVHRTLALSSVLFALFLACERCLGVMERLLIVSHSEELPAHLYQGRVAFLFNFKRNLKHGGWKQA